MEYVLERWSDAWDIIENNRYNMEDTFRLKDGFASFEARYLFVESADGVDGPRRAEILGAMVDAEVFIDDFTTKKAFQAEHGDKFNKWLKKFPIVGCLPIKKSYDTKIDAKLKEAFKDAFRNRVPGIIHGCSAFCTAYNIDPASFVENFDLDVVKHAVSSHFSQAEAAIITYALQDKAHAVIDGPNARAFMKTYASFLKDNDPQEEQRALWIAYHPDTNSKLVKKLLNSSVNVNYDTPVDAVRASLSKESGSPEIKKIEKCYKKPKFKASECVFDLRFSEATVGKYTAKILGPEDIDRMVMLGYDTHCCQKFEDIGESAMMHGLLNPHAGFFVVENTSTKEIYAQAEVWETEDRNELVFDNIEFANDAELSLYWPVIKAWLEGSTYPTITMGVGYNNLAGCFPTCDEPRRPWVTPREIQVISYEQESEAPILKTIEEAEEALSSGRVTYYDYVYCDSERRAEYLKKDGIVQEYAYANPDRSYCHDDDPYEEDEEYDENEEY